jgi:hypothetical protein
MTMSRNLLLTVFAVCSFSAVASETPVSTVVTAATDVAPSIFRRVGDFVWESGKTVVCSPVTFVDYVGAAKLAAYLGDVKPGAEAGFVANHSQAIARTTVALTTAAVIAAIYQAYQALVTEDDVEEGDEYFNVFETEDNDDEEEAVASDLE